MVDVELDEMMKSWWIQQAADPGNNFPGGKIPEEAVPGLVSEFIKVTDVDQQTAMQYAKDSGVLGTATVKQTTQQQTPASKPDTGTGEQMPKQLERGAINRLLEEILPSHTHDGNVDFDAVYAEIKKIAGKDYPKKRVYPAVYAAQKNLAKKSSPAGQSRKAAPSRPSTTQPQQETQPARPPAATAPSKATSIDKKIEEIKSQIAKLQEDLAALERVKAIMES